MTYTLTLEAEISAKRIEILAAAPNPIALDPLAIEWSSLMDLAIVEIGGFIAVYQGSNLRALLDWVDALSDAYFDAADWSSYSAYVSAAPTSITVEA